MPAFQTKNFLAFSMLAMPVILICLVGYSLIEKGVAVIYLNQIQTNSLNQFFMHYTHLGSGWIMILLGIFFAFVKYRISLLILIAGILQAVAMLIFKVLLFSEAPRPASFFEGIYPLNFVENVDILYFRSFPSGHTMTAFSVAALLAALSNNRLIHLCLLAYATLIGVSRMYLALHFLIDTTIGALLGLAVTLLSIFIVNRIEAERNGLLDGKLKF